MARSQGDVEIEGAAALTAARVGFWTAIQTATFAAAGFAMGILTPPRSGVFCTGACIPYPYSDAAQFVPGDFRWMIPALMLTPLFLVLMACIHMTAPSGKKLYSLIGLCFATVSMAVVTLDYIVQRDVVQPSLLKGETVGVALISQYNPHGVFIAMEDMGYLALSAAFLCAALAIPRGGKLAAAIRWIFLVSGQLSFASYLFLSWRFGADLDVKFELAVITFTWPVLVIEGVLLAVFFRRAAKNG